MGRHAAAVEAEASKGRLRSPEALTELHGEFQRVAHFAERYRKSSLMAVVTRVEPTNP